MRLLYWFLILLALSVTSYIREIIFLGVNEIIDQDFSYNPYSIQPEFLKSQSKENLIKLKFGLTAFFSLMIAFITVFGLKISLKPKFPFQLAILVYGILFSIAFVVGIGSIPFNKFQSVYPFLREIIEYLHNPLLFIVLSTIALAISANKTKSFED